MGRFRLSKRQVTHLLSECFAIEMAASTVVNQQQVSMRSGGKSGKGLRLVSG
jgi:hypothetical protein